MMVSLTLEIINDVFMFKRKLNGQTGVRQVLIVKGKEMQK